MPELPEVETVRRGLSQLIVGKKIKSVSNDNPKSFPNSKADTEQFLIGAEVLAVKRRAKLLLIELSSCYTLMAHLKMTGQLVFVGSKLCHQEESDVLSVGSTGGIRFGAGHPNDSLVGNLPDRSTRVDIEFVDGSHLFFNDQRKFGWMKLHPTIDVVNTDFMKKVGPEPLGGDMTNEVFIARMRRRNGTTTKAAILDQTVIAGVGNIYADEALWQAKIHPARRVREVTDEELVILAESIKDILQLAIDKGGSTDRNYVNAEGGRGSYLSFARVFRREDQPCFRHPEVLIEKIRIAGRGTHICPVCQQLMS